MRYELTDHEWAAIKPMLPNKPRGIPRVNDRIHVVVDTNGLPVQVPLTAGEAHDNRFAGKLLSCLKSGRMLLADRGYDALAAERGGWANIPPRRNRNEPICFSSYLYRARYLVGQTRSFCGVRPMSELPQRAEPCRR